MATQIKILRDGVQYLVHELSDPKPFCIKCKKLVEGFTTFKQPPRGYEFTSRCHGQVEKTNIPFTELEQGAWMLIGSAFEGKGPAVTSVKPTVPSVVQASPGPQGNPAAQTSFEPGAKLLVQASPVEPEKSQEALQAAPLTPVAPPQAGAVEEKPNEQVPAQVPEVAPGVQLEEASPPAAQAETAPPVTPPTLPVEPATQP